MPEAYGYDDKEENYPLSCEWIKIWLFSMPHYNVFLPYAELSGVLAAFRFILPNNSCANIAISFGSA